MESNHVIVDPSLLLAAEADNRPTQNYYDGFEFYISEAFADTVRANDEYVDDPTFEFFTGYLKFNELESYEKLESVVDGFETFSGQREEQRTNEHIDYERVHRHFQDRYSSASDGQIADVLYDEFVFLFERSWIASRVKKSQNKVTDVPGLRKFFFERNELDAIADQLPQKHQDKIRTLKSGRKWTWLALGIQVTGAGFAAPLSSAIFTAGLAQKSLALVFDP